MGKIEVEDLTESGLSKEQEEKYTNDFIDYLLSVSGKAAYLFYLSFEQTITGLFTVSEIAMKLGEITGKVSSSDFQMIRDKAKNSADDRMKLLEEKGALDVIKSFVDKDKVKQ